MTKKKTTRTPADHATKAKAKGSRSKPQAETPAKTPAKLSALDAAARLLEETKQPMSCPELIAALAAKGYWTSPAGKTPAATLYSALTREIHVKGKEARFKKAAPGKFTRS